MIKWRGKELEVEKKNQKKKKKCHKKLLQLIPEGVF